MSTRHAHPDAARSIDEWRDDSSICPQPILPEQFFAEPRIRIPEQRLMLAVLESALVDFYATATAPSGRERRIFIEVNRWFADDDATWPFSFARICEAFGLEPSVIRARLRRSLMADGTKTTTILKGRRMRRSSHEVNCKAAAGTIAWIFLFAILGLVAVSARQGYAEQPPPPCHSNPRAPVNMQTVSNRDDVRKLPAPLKQRLVQLAGRPHSFLPIQAFNEADKPSQLFQYYLLDTDGFEPNVFTARIAGVNDAAQLSVTGADCGLPTIGTVRVVLEPKPGLPTDPNDPRAFIDVFTDIDPLFVINNESGWYEGWMIHDLTVPTVAASRSDGSGAAQFGTITAADAAALKAMGSGNNVPGNIFTMDGMAVHFPNASDHFPDVQTNVVPLQESMGAYNAMQQSDVHAYWEFNYLGTNWIHPLYELPFTGGFPDAFGQAADTFADGEIGKLQSIVPGSGPNGIINSASIFGDNPNLPRDPDKFDGDVDAQREFRQRGIPSGLANEVFLDVYERPASFEPSVTDLERRLFDAYAAEVSRVDQNGDGIISAVEGDIDTATDGFPDNARLFLPATAFNRFAVTREINDGLLAPRFAPSQRAWILTGTRVPVSPAVPASTGRDADDR